MTEMQITPEPATRLNLGSMQGWKKKRRAIVLQLVPCRLHESDPFMVPTNVVRSHHWRDFGDETTSEQRERTLFDDFLTVCRGWNTEHVKCEIDHERRELKWDMAGGCSDAQERWMHKCFRMATSLFELVECLSRIRQDKTRGPTVATFCSVVSKYLRRELYPALEQLDTMEGKNLLSLQRRCSALDEVLSALKEVACEIEECDRAGGELLNFLYRESQSDARVHVAELLTQAFSLSLKRYNITLHEWVSQGTLTTDIAHEFFVWDLAKSTCVKRADFAAQQDGTDFDSRYVLVEELVPDVYKQVARQILEAGMYLCTMKSQNADLALMAGQMSLEGEAFRNKSIGEVRQVIRQLHQQCSVAVLCHLDAKLSVSSFALRLPHYYLAHHSYWLDELVALYASSNIAGYDEGLVDSPVVLQALLDKALDRDWMRADEFRSRFQLHASKFHFLQRHFLLLDDDGKTTVAAVEVPLPELRINGDATLSLAFPKRVTEAYHQLFRTAFILRRARHLLVQKRFSLEFKPSRRELIALNLMRAFVCAYHDFIFADSLERAFYAFESKLGTQQTTVARSLDALIDEQHEFLCALLDHAKLDLERKQFADVILSIVMGFSSYARGEIPFKALNSVVGLKICQLKRTLLRNNDLAELRYLLFGCNFVNISTSEADLEPLHESLRYIEPLQQPF